MLKGVVGSGLKAASFDFVAKCFQGVIMIVIKGLFYSLNSQHKIKKIAKIILICKPKCQA